MAVDEDLCEVCYTNIILKTGKRKEVIGGDRKGTFIFVCDHRFCVTDVNEHFKLMVE
jgi:hypothetical protein